jgi:hypothetical protein
VNPAKVGCLEIQPIVTIGAPADVQSQVSREQVSMFGDTATAAVNTLTERLLHAVPAQARLGQGSGSGAVLEQALAAGAFSLATDCLHEHPRCPIPHRARKAFLPRDIIQLLAGDVCPVGEQLVCQRAVQCLAVLGEPTVKLRENGCGPFGGGSPLPLAATFVGAIRVEAARRPGAVLSIQSALGAPQPSRI